MIAYNVTVKENVLKKDLYYKDHFIMTYTIKYPQFVSDKFKLFIRKLNLHYKAEASLFQRAQIAKLYQTAIDDYEYSVANGFPIRPYEVFVEYTVTYNQNCTLSLYFDRYEYTGGAHGMTYRKSDTWDLRKGRRMDLMDFFPGKKDFIKYVQLKINSQIEADLKENKGMFFEDYTTLVKENFHSNNFYLTDQGVVIYFQLYEIAPYVSGIQIFTLPFSEGNAAAPEC